MKHNKKRNTAFIYETLIRELTKAILDKDSTRKQQITAILKEFFSPSEILAQELELYKVLLETKNLERPIAEKILQESKIAHARLDEKTIFDAQSQIISAINKGLGATVWSNFVPNFKALASVSSVFNSKTAVKKRVLFEQSVVERMSAQECLVESQELKSLDSLSYKTFINKFNQKYGNLLQEQQNLLNRYITSFADDGFELRLYLNDELSRMKNYLTESSEKEPQAAIAQKMTAVVEYLESLRKREFVDGDLNRILKAQELIEEIQTNDLH